MVKEKAKQKMFIEHKKSSYVSLFAAIIVVAIIGAGFVTYMFYFPPVTDYEAEYERGRVAGFANGNSSGYIQGYMEGEVYGNSSGWLLGNQSGFAFGNQSGFAFGNQSGIDYGFLLGYLEGNSTGYCAGFLSGYNVGYLEAYDIGYNSAMEYIRSTNPPDVCVFTFETVFSNSYVVNVNTTQNAISGSPKFSFNYQIWWENMYELGNIESDFNATYSVSGIGNMSISIFRIIPRINVRVVITSYSVAFYQSGSIQQANTFLDPLYDEPIIVNTNQTCYFDWGATLSEDSQDIIEFNPTFTISNMTF